MGRFASTVEFYARYREPYSSAFFKKVASELRWSGSERLLDVGCGPGLLTCGFAPYVGRAIGVDIEPGMLLEATRAAGHCGGKVSFIQSRFEDFDCTDQFNIVTIGRALHWLDRSASLRKLTELLLHDGVVLECGASVFASEVSPWLRAYNDARRRWITEDEEITRGNRAGWFAGSDFRESRSVSVKELYTVTVDELIARALSRSNTSPEALGPRRAQFEAELRETLAPFAEGGVLQEEIVGRATVFTRQIVR